MSACRIGSSVNQIALFGRGPERLADGFFGLLREISGYVIVVPQTFAKGVRV